MSETDRTTRYTEKPTDNPYKDLYIYYIDGLLKPDNKTYCNDFIGNWEEDGFSFLFFSRPSLNEVEKLLDTQPQLTLLDNFHMTYDDWQGGTIAPFRVGRFFIAPPWERPWDKIDTCKNELNIILDPGVVFGTGTHHTTHDCLEALDLTCCEKRVESVLDLGTGTGLLALAAARLGCKNTLAVDFNFLAARTTKKNIMLNRLEDRVLAVQGMAEDFIDHPADLVIANIHYDVMKHLLTSEGFLRKKWFILSGLLRSQARDVAYKLSQHPFKILKKWDRKGIWHTFFGKIEADS